MAKIDANINELKSLVTEDFSDCIRRYTSSVNSFFDVIKNYNGWEGEAASRYLPSVITESKQYENFGDSLLNFYTVLYSAVEDLEMFFTSGSKK